MNRAISPIVSATLLIAFSEFSLATAIPVVLGTFLIVFADRIGDRIAGFVGFLIVSIGTVLTVRISDLTDIWIMLSVAFLFVAPLSMLLWSALVIGDERGPQMLKPNFRALTIAAITVFIVLVAIPITELALHSAELSSDIGTARQILIITFASALLAAVLLGRDSERDRVEQER